MILLDHTYNTKSIHLIRGKSRAEASATYIIVPHLVRVTVRAGPDLEFRPIGGNALRNVEALVAKDPDIDSVIHDPLLILLTGNAVLDGDTSTISVRSGSQAFHWFKCQD